MSFYKCNGAYCKWERSNEMCWCDNFKDYISIVIILMLLLLTLYSSVSGLYIICSKICSFAFACTALSLTLSGVHFCFNSFNFDSIVVAISSFLNLSIRDLLLLSSSVSYSVSCVEFASCTPFGLISSVAFRANCVYLCYRRGA